MKRIKAVAIQLLTELGGIVGDTMHACPMWELLILDLNGEAAIYRTLCIISLQLSRYRYLSHSTHSLSTQLIP